MQAVRDRLDGHWTRLVRRLSEPNSALLSLIREHGHFTVNSSHRTSPMVLPLAGAETLETAELDAPGDVVTLLGWLLRRGPNVAPISAPVPDSAAASHGTKPAAHLPGYRWSPRSGPPDPVETPWSAPPTDTRSSSQPSGGNPSDPSCGTTGLSLTMIT